MKSRNHIVANLIYFSAKKLETAAVCWGEAYFHIYSEELIKGFRVLEEIRSKDVKTEGSSWHEQRKGATLRLKGPVPCNPGLGVISITFTFVNQFGANLRLRIKLS